MRLGLHGVPDRCFGQPKFVHHQLRLREEKGRERKNQSLEGKKKEGTREKSPASFNTAKSGRRLAIFGCARRRKQKNRQFADLARTKCSGGVGCLPRHVCQMPQCHASSWFRSQFTWRRTLGHFSILRPGLSSCPVASYPILSSNVFEDWR